MTHPALVSLADTMGMDDPEDLRYYLTEELGIDLHEDEIPKPILFELWDVFDPRCERSEPDCYPDLEWPLPARDGYCRCAAGMGGREHRKGSGCT